MSNAVTTQQTAAVALPVNPMIESAAQLITSIARAASDPKVDTTKMRELMNMRNEIMAEQRQIAFDSDFSMMQAELPEVIEKGDIKGESKKTGTKIDQSYAKFEDILAAVRPILGRYGFGVRFTIDDTSEKDVLIVTCILSHRDGHREQTSKRLPKDHSGSKNAVQAEGSSVSYGKRYTMNAILNIATRGEDDDGRAAAAPVVPSITDKQKEMINNALGAPELIAMFCKDNDIKHLGEIESGSFDTAHAKAKRYANKYGVDDEGNIYEHGTGKGVAFDNTIGTGGEDAHADAGDR